MLTRRTLLASTAPGAVLVLAGCAGGSTGTVSTWVAGIQAIATSVASILPAIETAANVPAATVASITSLLQEIQQAASTVTTAATALTGQSVLAQIEGYINALAPLVLPFVSIIPGGSVIGLIVASLPAIEALLNFVTALTSQALSLASAAPVPAALVGRRGGAIKLTPAVSQLYLNVLIQRAALSRSHRLKHSR